MASSREHGKDLPSVQLLMKKNQVRQRQKSKEKIPRASPDVEVGFVLKPGVSLAPLEAVWNPRLQWLAFLHGGRAGPVLVGDQQECEGA